MKIPATCMSVVKVLRREVEKPTGKLLSMRFSNNCRFESPDSHGYCCPMGLHPRSHNPTPTRRVDFADGACSQKAVGKFAEWWDSLSIEEAKTAIDLIWPKPKKKRKKL